MTNPTNILQEMLSAQDLLQRETYGNSPRELLHHNDGGHAPEAVEFISWNVQAAVDELHELLGETGWKPWATSRHVNIEAARGELIDVMHFVMNLAHVLEMDAEMIHERYMAKRTKNIARQTDGYDGVSTKCPACKRAYDDDAVYCTPAHPTTKHYAYCDTKDIFIDEDGKQVDL